MVNTEGYLEAVVSAAQRFMELGGDATSMALGVQALELFTHACESARSLEASKPRRRRGGRNGGDRDRGRDDRDTSATEMAGSVVRRIVQWGAPRIAVTAAHKYDNVQVLHNVSSFLSALVVDLRRKGNGDLLAAVIKAGAADAALRTCEVVTGKESELRDDEAAGNAVVDSFMLLLNISDLSGIADGRRDERRGGGGGGGGGAGASTARECMSKLQMQGRALELVRAAKAMYASDDDVQYLVSALEDVL